jgi:hypothetical protein
MTMTQFSQSTSLVHSGTNDTRLNDFMSQVREFGRDSASGKDALPKLAHAVVRAVCDGVVDTAKDADGNDAAARIFTEYVKSEGKKAVHERTGNGLKANISKLRQIVNFAGNPKWDAVDVMNRAFACRQDLVEHDIDPKPAYASYVDLAREQLKQDDALTDEQIAAVMMKTTKEREVTLQGELEKMKKKVEGFITGEDKNGIKDQSPELIQIQELLGQKLAALMISEQEAEDARLQGELDARRAARDQAAHTIEGSLAA